MPKKQSLEGEKKAEQVEYVSAVGRRKNAIARVRVYPKVKDNMMFGDTLVRKGDIVVNHKHISAYFPSETAKVAYLEPLRLTNTLNSYAVTIRVTGGGLSGQLGAVVHGLSRALTKIDQEKHYPILKKSGMLTRDARTRQRRNVGMGGKSRRKKQSPKR